MVRRHLTPDGMFAFDIFNPNIRILAGLADQRFSVIQVETESFGTLSVGETNDYGSATHVPWPFSVHAICTALCHADRTHKNVPQESPAFTPVYFARMAVLRSTCLSSQASIRSATWRLFLSCMSMWLFPLSPSLGRYIISASPPADFTRSTNF